jgi:hypothetical protein
MDPWFPGTIFYPFQQSIWTRSTVVQFWQSDLTCRQPLCGCNRGCVSARRFIGFNPKLMSNLCDIRFEVRLRNRSQSVNFLSCLEICFFLRWSRMWNIIGKWYESIISETMTSESLIFLCITISSISPLTIEEECIGHRGAEISKLLLPNNCNSFWPVFLETALF